jgi:WD40 repeat protein
MAADASRFSFVFADVISASVPHIYLSALPFAPPSSLVSKRYCDLFPRTIKVLHDSAHEEGVKWPAMRFSISASHDGDQYEVYDISIHPDGRKVAAAMDDSVAMVFSMTTGETMFPLSGHMGSVHAIAYSPRGEKIATGAILEPLRFPRFLKKSEGCNDGCLRMYDAKNGSILFSLSDLHSDWIRSVAWSPDGKR